MSPCHEQISGLDEYFSHQNASELHNSKLVATVMGRVHILSSASLSNCNGTITTIEFCYQTKGGYLGQKQSIFDLLFLAQQENSTMFAIERIIYVTTTPQNITSCTASENGFFVCCASETLSEVDRFEAPLNSTIGVRSTQTRNNILHFNTTAFGVNETFFGVNEVVVLNDSTVGSTFEFTAANQTSEGSLLLRFRTGLPITLYSAIVCIHACINLKKG